MKSAATGTSGADQGPTRRLSLFVLLTELPHAGYIQGSGEKELEAESEYVQDGAKGLAASRRLRRRVSIDDCRGRSRLHTRDLVELQIVDCLRGSRQVKVTALQFEVVLLHAAHGSQQLQRRRRMLLQKKSK